MHCCRPEIAFRFYEAFSSLCFVPFFVRNWCHFTWYQSLSGLWCCVALILAVRLWIATSNLPIFVRLHQIAAVFITDLEAFCIAFWILFGCILLLFRSCSVSCSVASYSHSDRILHLVRLHLALAQMFEVFSDLEALVDSDLNVRF